MRGHVRYRLVRGPLRPAILATNTDSSASMRSDTPESRFPLSIAIRIASTLSTFSTSSPRHFRLLSSSPENSATYDLCQFGARLALTARART